MRTFSWVADDSSPASATACATDPSSVMPRIWMLPRDVSSMSGEQKSVADRASARSCAAVIIPPGSLTRASGPSAARCSDNAPGQASTSRALRAIPTP